MRHLALEDYSASRIFLRRCSLMNSLLVGCGMILANQKLSGKKEVGQTVCEIIVDFKQCMRESERECLERDGGNVDGGIHSVADTCIM